MSLKHIKQLSQDVIGQIAAGEVVERPASAVKELIENAIDAHADHITVEIRNGGIAMLRISDNGVGMTREDACACFERHATSKIASEADLTAISTLGFRGEALAAISAVSKIELVTRYKDEPLGTRVLVEAGEVIDCEEWGAPIGTTITVSNLFYNTPARMKFMKKDATEAMYVAGAVDKIALSHPEIAVRFIKDGREAMHTTGDGSLYAAIHSVLGHEFAETLIPIPESQSPHGFLVSGYVTKPERSRPNRNMQYFFLNERSIKNRAMGAALEEAYRDSMMVGKFPGCILHMWTDPARVDCNVHPAKTEVKFADERAAFEAVYFAVKNAVTGLAHPTASVPAAKPAAVPVQPAPASIVPPTELKTAPVSSTPAKSQPSTTEAKTRYAYTQPKWEPVHSELKMEAPIRYDSGTPKPFSEPTQPTAVRSDTVVTDRDLPDLTIAARISNAPSVSEAKEEQVAIDIYDIDIKSDESSKVPPYRILGDLFDSFIVVETGNEALFIDKHAAHERIIYNRLLTTQAQSEPQVLMTPAVVSVSKEELALINENRELLEEIGLSVEDFGGNTVAVRELPAHIDEDGIPALISEVASHLSRVNADRNTARDNILHTMACKAAVKAGRKSGALELDRLVKDVLTLKDVRYCPHGRPVAIVMTKADFEKNFKRI